MLICVRQSASIVKPRICCLTYREMMKILDLQNLTFSLRENARLDYFVAGMWWAKQEAYSVEQTSAFFTVLDILIKNVGLY